MDTIFKALNDPTRRALLDSLRARDGQTLQELQEAAEMTRFGIMAHLKILEAASLITTRKVGRYKYHYLNAVPLQQVIDRWIEPFLAKPAARAMLDLKSQLEGQTMTTDTLVKPDFVLETFIRTTLDALWDALTRADVQARFHFACQDARGDGAAKGEAIEFIREDGSTMLRQEVTAIDPKTRIEMTFEPQWANALPSRVAYIVEPQGEVMKLRMEHFEIPEGQEGIKEGWARWSSSLKSFLETGQPIRIPM